MPDVADSKLRQIAGRSLITAAAFAAEIRDWIVDFFRRLSPLDPSWQAVLLDPFHGRLNLLRDHIHYSKIVSWITGFDWAAGKTPDWVFDEPSQPPAIRPPQQVPGRPPSQPPLFPPSIAEGPEELRFPKIEEAANRLIERNILSREAFDAASREIQQDAFTVAGEIENDTIETIRDTLAEDIRQGTSLDGFSDRLSERLGTSRLGDGHLETVYRTNVQSAFRDGRETLMQDPVVASAFPYQEYVHIGDDRVRDEHARLSQLGLNGTNVYRRDDPFWDHFTPPWDYNCRCAVNVLTLEAAAARGVKEAQSWLETGQPPLRPEYRLAAIPFRPKAGFGSRGRVAV